MTQSHRPLALLLLCVACASRAAAPAASPAPPPDPRTAVLFDTDANNELDDQHAIAYLLANADLFRIVGITTHRTKNGGDIDQHTAEARRIVKLMASETAVPVVPGARGEFEAIAPTLDRPDFDGHQAVAFIREQARAASPEKKLVLLAVGKLTNVALALKAEPAIAARVRVLWLGSNWPDPGEYNLEDDPPSAAFVVDSGVELDVATVRYGKPSGTAAVKVSTDEIRQRMPGLGPRVAPVPGRHGGEFSTFGDYSISLFENVRDKQRALFDMAAVAVLKNPAWGKWTAVPAPKLEGKSWSDRPDNLHKVRFITDFDRQAIVEDLFARLKQPVLPPGR